MATLVSFKPKDIASKAHTQPENPRGNRPPESFRPLFVKPGVSSESSGSSYLELGGTKLVCSVNGPRLSQTSRSYSSTGSLRVSLRVASFNFNGADFSRLGNLHGLLVNNTSSNNGGAGHISDGSNLSFQKGNGDPWSHPSDFEKVAAMQVDSALSGAVRLDLYPKSDIEISVLVIADDGGVIPAAIIAASIALADAGIEMIDLVAAMGSACIDGKVVLDPSYAELAPSSSSSSENDNNDDNGDDDTSSKNSKNSKNNKGNSGNTSNASAPTKSVSILTVSAMSSLDEVTHVHASGVFPGSSVAKATAIARDACAKAAEIMRESLISSAIAKGKGPKKSKRKTKDAKKGSDSKSEDTDKKKKKKSKKSEDDNAEKKTKKKKKSRE